MTLEQILGALYVIGVNPLDVRMQSINGGYKLTFSKDGEQKQIYYASITLPKQSCGDNGYKTAIDFLERVAQDNNVQRTGVFVKSDLFVVTPGFLQIYKPDVLIHNGKAIFNNTTILDDYKQVSLGGDEKRYHEIQFGYAHSPTQVVIGTRK